MAGATPDTPAARIDANTKTARWAGVGSISVGGGTFTGALIDRTHVLTAAHVVGGAKPDSITFNLNFGGDLTQRIAVAAVFTHPLYQGFGHGNPGDDLAVLQLAQSAPLGVPTYGLYRDELPQGARLTLVGYGASGNGDKGVSMPAQPHVKRTGQNSADRYASGDGLPGQAHAFYYDFDGPDASSNAMGGHTLGNPLETTVASGDSGGPAFVRGPRNTWLIAGINTFDIRANDKQPRGTFGTGGGGVLVAPQVAWIDRVRLGPGKPG